MEGSEGLARFFSGDESFGKLRELVLSLLDSDDCPRPLFWWLCSCAKRSAVCFLRSYYAATEVAGVSKIFRSLINHTKAVTT
jgi:hypothetical protein